MGHFRLEKGILVLDRDEIAGTPEYHAILKRDKGSEGDAQGRQKAFAFKVFYYIWYKYDLQSPGNVQGLDKDTLEEKAKKEARLPEDWKPDEVVNAAGKKYYDENNISELVLLNSSIRACNIVSKATARLADNIEFLYSTYEKEIEAKKARKEIVNLAEDLANLNSINTAIEQVLKMGGKVPKLLEDMEAQRMAFMKKAASGGNIRGGHTKGNRADPPRK